MLVSFSWRQRAASEEWCASPPLSVILGAAAWRGRGAGGHARAFARRDAAPCLRRGPGAAGNSVYNRHVYFLARPPESSDVLASRPVSQQALSSSMVSFSPSGRCVEDVTGSSPAIAHACRVFLH
eukprot:scaffold84649_cov75-Phaeocystis_antarctica.AAC.1